MIKKGDKNVKYYYHDLGLYLTEFKDVFLGGESEFNKFISSRYDIKVSDIEQCMSFYDLSSTYIRVVNLPNCGLTYTEILDNLSEIEEILKDQIVNREHPLDYTGYVEPESDSDEESDFDSD